MLAGDAASRPGVVPTTPGHSSGLATKIWAEGKAAGEEQVRQSMELMKADGVIDLMQVHDLLDTDTHFGTIREFQQAQLVVDRRRDHRPQWRQDPIHQNRAADMPRL